jgi:hypothetical protein
MGQGKSLMKFFNFCVINQYFMSGVSQSWYNQVNAYNLFSTIVKSLKEVVEESKT